MSHDKLTEDAIRAVLTEEMRDLYDNHGDHIDPAEYQSACEMYALERIANAELRAENAGLIGNDRILREIVGHTKRVKNKYITADTFVNICASLTKDIETEEAE